VLVVTTPDPNASASAGVPGVQTSGAAGGGPPGGGPSSARTPAGPSPSGPLGVRLRRLLDPAGALRAAVPGLASPSPGPNAHGTLLLVSSDWAVVQVVPTTLPMSELKDDLDRLAG